MNIRVYLPDGTQKFYENVDYTVGKENGCLYITKRMKRVMVYSPLGWLRVDLDAEKLGKPSIVVV